MMSFCKTVAVLTVLFGLALSQNKPWDPVTRTEEWWLQRHQQFLNSTASQADKINVVFIGSSSVENWGTTGKDIWNSKYAPLGSINYGLGGDRTEHVIWRIQEGELDGLKPKLVVVYIGSNNLPVFPNNDEIVRGVDTVITKIHEKVPNSNVLLVGFFPRGDMNPVNATLQREVDINTKLKNLVDGDTQRKSHFLNLFDFLAPPTLDKINEELYMGDKLHLNLLGYQMWDKEMNSTFYSLLN